MVNKKIGKKTEEHLVPKEKKFFYLELIKNTIKTNKINFIIGLITFLIFSLIGYNYFIKNINKNKKIPSNSIKINQEKSKEKISKKYKVKEGDTLWQIAENFYGSGYNAIDIAFANKLSDPNLITESQELIIPQITPKISTKGEVVPNQTKKVSQYQKRYIIKQGDTLWKIALENYGDGYAWVKIANQNKIINPDIIEPGLTIILP